MSSLDGDEDSDEEESDDNASHTSSYAADDTQAVRRRASASSAGNSPGVSPRGSLRERRERIELERLERERSHTSPAAYEHIVPKGIKTMQTLFTIWSTAFLGYFGYMYKLLYYR